MLTVFLPFTLAGNSFLDSLASFHTRKQSFVLLLKYDMIYDILNTILTLFLLLLFFLLL